MSLEQNMKLLILINWMGKQENRCTQRWGSNVDEGVGEQSMEGKDHGAASLHPFLLASLVPQATKQWRGKSQRLERRKNRVVCPRRRGYSAHPIPCSSSRTGGKSGIRRVVFPADLQVAAWPSCQRPAQFLHTPIAAVGLRTVLRALSALGMINGAAPSLYPEGNWACNILEVAERLPEPLSNRRVWTLYPFGDVPETFCWV